MITKREKLLWSGYVLLLVILLLLSSTDLIIKEKEREIYPVSVIVEDADDGNYVNFRKGMELAAMEENADVSFVTLYETGNLGQQQEMIRREEQEGAKALVVAPAFGVSSGQIAKETEQPSVLVWTAGEADGAASVITTDFGAMGEELAQRIGENCDRDIPVYLFGRTLEQESAGSFEAALSPALEGMGFSVRVTLGNPQEICGRILERIAGTEKKGAVIVGLDPDCLEETVSLLKADENLRYCVRGLYGRGSSLAILDALDEGIIRGLCVTDDFRAGYLCIRRAVEAACGQKTEPFTVLEHYYIEKEDLRQPRYEKMLYPIE